MYEIVFDLGVIFFFLILLVLAARERNRRWEYHPRSWKEMMVGGVLLITAGGINLISALDGVIVSSTAGWQPILHATGISAYVAGGTLVLLGLSKWCRSMGKIRSSAMQRLRRLACLKALLSVIQRRSELNEMLKESLSQLMNIMGYKMGVVFRPTFRSSEMILVGHVGAPVKNLYSLYDLYVKNTWYREARSSQRVMVTRDVMNLPEQGMLFSDGDGIRSLVCVPITFSGKVLGLLGLYDTQEDRFSFQEIQFLTSVGETLGMAAKQNLVSDRNKKRKDCISVLENILDIAEQGSSPEDAFLEISRELKKVVEFDRFTLALTSDSVQNTRTISVGESGSMLLERRADSFFGTEAMRQAMKSGEVQIDHDLCVNENPEGAASKAWGIRSRIILPLKIKGSICGAISLGHKNPGFYCTGDARWIRPIALSLSQIILQEKLKKRLEKEMSLHKSLGDFGSKLVTDEEPGSLMAEVASSLVADLPRSFTRITLLSRQKDQLINCAMHQIRSEGINLKKEARFSLDELPWHRLTLKAKRPMLVNQSDPESIMSHQEAQLILDRKIGSALLVPVMLNQEAVGVVSVGEMRSWDRQSLTKQDIDFVKHKADQLSLAIKKEILRRSNRQLAEKLNRKQKSESSIKPSKLSRTEPSDLNFQIVNSLTSIRGSAELLRLRQPDLSPSSLKYLGNIERRVERIQENLEEFLNSTGDDSLPQIQGQSILSSEQLPDPSLIKEPVET